MAETMRRRLLPVLTDYTMSEENRRQLLNSLDEIQRIEELERSQETVEALAIEVETIVSKVVQSQADLDRMGEITERLRERVRYNKAQSQLWKGVTKLLKEAGPQPFPAWFFPLAVTFVCALVFAIFNHL